MVETRPAAKRSVSGLLFGIYAWLVFVLCVLVAVIAALMVPGLERRRRFASACARAVFRLTGTPTEVSGSQNLPEGQSIVVANHASYVDGVILTAFLPPRFGFVIKGEMQNFPVVHFMLRRLGSRFVERYIASGSSRDARRLVKAASAGESLAFFPEGTFLDRPGLDRFRPGAFAAAIKGDLPVVPVVIHGSRQVMPALLPRRGRIGVEILAAIPPDDPSFDDSATLADLARQRILERLDEPDLAAEQVAPA